MTGRIKKMMKSVVRDAAWPSVKTTAWLLKIMLPISLAVSLMQHYGVIAWCAQWLNPVFIYLGLPGASAIAFLTGASVTTYASLAVMLSMELTMREATIIAVMVLICHALPLESAVVSKVGSNPFKMAILRIIGAFAAAAYLNLVLPEMSTPFNEHLTTANEQTLNMVLMAWLQSSVKMTAMIMGIIFSLMVIQRLMDRTGIMQRLVKPLEPLMIALGLPRGSAYLWLVGNVLGISYGSAAMIDLKETGKITEEEANEVNYHLIMNHSMLEDTMVFATAGVSALWILSTRMIFALLLVWGRKIFIKSTLQFTKK